MTASAWLKQGMINMALNRPQRRNIDVKFRPFPDYNR